MIFHLLKMVRSSCHKGDYNLSMQISLVNLGIIREHTEVQVNKELGKTDCPD